MDAVIYKLTIVGHNELFYIGSSAEFDKRMTHHMTSIKSSNTKLYKAIRANGGEIDAEILYEFKCDTLEDQWIEEQKWLDKLLPPLNSNKAHRCKTDIMLENKHWRLHNKEYHQQYHKNWRSKNKDYYKAHYQQNKDKYINYYQQKKAELQKRVTCICGSTPTQENLLKHMRTNKHHKLLAQLNSVV